MVILSGTNGVRGRINDGITPELVLQVGKYVGSMYGGTIAVATDYRVSGRMVKGALCAGLMSVGCNILDLGELPTSALHHFISRHEGLSGGVMVTASHDATEFNGLKFITPDGMEDPIFGSVSVEKVMATEIPGVPWHEVGEMTVIGGVLDGYLDDMLSMVDIDLIRSAGFRICVDCSNGSAFHVAPRILSHIGVEFMTINGSASGAEPDSDSELTEDNFNDLAYITSQATFNLGVGFDMDGDRCLFVTQDGDIVPGDKEMAIIARSILSQRKGKVICPISSTSVVEDVVNENGGIMKYTGVGSPLVARKAKEYDAIFGGEINGGLIFPEFQYCRDGFMAMLRMLEAIARNGPLSEQADALPTYSYVTHDLPFPMEKRDMLINYFRELRGNHVTDLTDGIKFIYDDGWVLIRPSTTESMIRLYSQADTTEIAEEKISSMLSKIDAFLNDTGLASEVLAMDGDDLVDVPGGKD